MLWGVGTQPWSPKLCRGLPSFANICANSQSSGERMILTIFMPFKIMMIFKKKTFQKHVWETFRIFKGRKNYRNKAHTINTWMKLESYEEGISYKMIHWKMQVGEKLPIKKKPNFFRFLKTHWTQRRSRASQTLAKTARVQQKGGFWLLFFGEAKPWYLRK